MRGVLVRVGIDATDGRWHAPASIKTKDFAFITIMEKEESRKKKLDRIYEREFSEALKIFGKEIPSHLIGERTHLDPDFSKLTYGDRGQRAKCIQNKNQALVSGDIITFYASMKPIDGPKRPLIYGIIGLYVIDKIVMAKDISPKKWDDNAHSRCKPTPQDIVVYARKGVSGRLIKYIPIGEIRNKSYRVRKELLKEWGDLYIKDGYIQRSVYLPEFVNADRFYKWFKKQKATLIANNNPVL